MRLVLCLAFLATTTVGLLALASRDSVSASSAITPTEQHVVPRLPANADRPLSNSITSGLGGYTAQPPDVDDDSSKIEVAVGSANVPAAPGFCFYPLVKGDVWGRATVEPSPKDDIDPLDAMFILRKIAGFFLPGGGVTCSPMDIDCDGDVDPVDALQILRWIAGLPVHQDEGCLEIGTPFGPYSATLIPAANGTQFPSTDGTASGKAVPAAPGGCVLPLVMGDVWGRVTNPPDPENDIDPVDALFILRKIGGFFLVGGPACSSMDIDCDFDIDAVDALSILRWIARLPYTQAQNCIEIGTPYGPYS